MPGRMTGTTATGNTGFRQEHIVETQTAITWADNAGGALAAPGYRWVLEEIEVARDSGSATTSENLTVTVDRSGTGDVLVFSVDVTDFDTSYIMQYGWPYFTYEATEGLTIACTNTESCTYTMIIKISRMG